jgi:hypothetical protein
VVVGVSAWLFAGSATLTIVWSVSMSEMPGGWTMSMAWMRIPRRMWLGAATSFLGMWVDDGGDDAAVLMLRRYREVIARTGAGHG